VAEQTECLIDGCCASATFCNFHADPCMTAEIARLREQVARLQAEIARLRS